MINDLKNTVVKVIKISTKTKKPMNIEKESLVKNKKRGVFKVGIPRCFRNFGTDPNENLVHKTRLGDTILRLSRKLSQNPLREQRKV